MRTTRNRRSVPIHPHAFSATDQYVIMGLNPFFTQTPTCNLGPIFQRHVLSALPVAPHLTAKPACLLQTLYKQQRLALLLQAAYRRRRDREVLRLRQAAAAAALRHDLEDERIRHALALWGQRRLYFALMV